MYGRAEQGLFLILSQVIYPQMIYHSFCCKQYDRKKTQFGRCADSLGAKLAGVCRGQIARTTLVNLCFECMGITKPKTFGHENG